MWCAGCGVGYAVAMENTISRQRFYVDGKLTQSVKGPVERLRRWIDNAERDWSRDGMFPLTPAGEFDCNKAHSVTRVSPDELIIMNTGGKILRWINVA